MEHPIQPKTEIKGGVRCAMCGALAFTCNCPAKEGVAVVSVEEEARIKMSRPIGERYEGVSAARLVDEKITDVVRLTVAACNIVLESDGCPDEFRARMQVRVFQMLGVKERRT